MGWAGLDVRGAVSGCWCLVGGWLWWFLLYVGVLYLSECGKVVFLFLRVVSLIRFVHVCVLLAQSIAGFFALLVLVAC